MHILSSALLALALTLTAGAAAQANTAAASAQALATVARTVPAPDTSAGDTSKIAPYQARFGRARPVVAVVGANGGTELSDFVAPYAILAQSGAADVLALSTVAGPIRMRPALRVAAHATLAEFDRRYADGADYIIVPALADAGDAQLIAWLQAQAAKGATVVSICDGALVVARAGLFDGRRATGHWATQGQRERDYPRVQWQKNVRWVADGKVVSSAGISAAIPTSLALVEAIAGRGRADAVAAAIGAGDWSARHDSEQFGINAGMLFTLARNKLFSSKDTLAIKLEPGLDELTLALGADALARTGRAKVVAVSAGGEPVRSRHGLDIVPDQLDSKQRITPLVLPVLPPQPQQSALDAILVRISDAYGKGTAKLVADTLEYPLAAALP